MLETSFPSFISKKLGEVPIFRTFLVKIQFWRIFHCKSANLCKIDNYDVIVTSCMGCLYLFWYVWKKETHSYTIVSNKYTSGVYFSSSQGKIAWLDEG